MQNSKMWIFKSLLGAFTATSLVACNLPSPQNKELKGSETATFTAQPMADKSKALETYVEGSFALPSKKIFNLQACIKDVAYDKPVSGHDFLIEEVSKTVTSDKAGCVTWSELINYNFLADSQYIRIERHIKGTGLHKGARKVSFAINPWSHGENLAPVLNPDDGNTIPRLMEDTKKVESTLKGLSADNTQIQRPLWVEDGRLFVSEQKLTQKGVDLLVEMRPSVSVQLAKMNGEFFLRPLTEGSFKATLKMIHIYQQEGKEVHRLLSESDAITAKMTNGTLALKSVMSLAAIPTRGQIMMGLTLQPVQGPAGLVGFDGLYLLGEYDQIKGSSFLKLNTLVSQTKNFKIADYVNANIKDVAASSTKGTIDEETYQKPKIEVSPLEFKFVRIGKETTTTREVFFNVKACLRNGLDQKTTRSHTFKVTKFQQDGSTAATVDIKSDNSSCLNWDDSITFKYFDCQKYLKGQVQIENKELGLNETLQVVVNPWENSSVIGRDLRYVEQNENLVTSCQSQARPQTQLVADSYNYSTLSYNYGVDSLLNLYVTKKIQLKMDARLLVYSNLANGRGEVEKLRDGFYLLRFAVIRNRDYDSNNTYVTSAEKIVNVLNGQINTELSLTTNDLKALGNRNTALVEIKPVLESKISLQTNGQITLKKNETLDSVIDSSAGLTSGTFVGPITLNMDEASRPLRLLDTSSVNSYLLNAQVKNGNVNQSLIKQIVTKGLADKAKIQQFWMAKSEKSVMAKDSNLDLLNLNTADVQAPLVKAIVGQSQLNKTLIATKAELQSFVKNGVLTPDLAQKMCAFWASDYFRKLNANKGGTLNDHQLSIFSMDCYNTVRTNPKAFFQTELHLIAKQVGGSQFVKGLNQGLSVGTSFAVSTAHSESRTRSLSMSVKLGLSKKFMDLISMGADLGYNMSWSTSDAKSSYNSLTVARSTSLTVQQNIFKIRLDKYEQCAIVRLNPALFIKDSSWFGRKDYLSTLNARLTDDEKAQSVTRGLMICDGEIKTNPVAITESYFLVAQESSSTQMQDNGDARNRNFFIALRSQNEFNRFVVGMKGSAKTPETSAKEEDTQADATNTMENLFRLGSSTQPGYFRVP